MDPHSHLNQLAKDRSGNLPKPLKQKKASKVIQTSKRNLEENESSGSDSGSSNFTEFLDADVKQIKMITKTLTEGLKSELKAYKSLSKVYSHQTGNLKKQIITLQEESNSLNEVRLEASEINEKLESIKDLIRRNTSKPNVQKNSIEDEENFNLALQKLQVEVEIIKEKYKSDAVGVSLNRILDSRLSEHPPALEAEGKKSNCTCFIV